jgi:hypothetical protein
MTNKKVSDGIRKAKQLKNYKLFFNEIFKQFSDVEDIDFKALQLYCDGCTYEDIGDVQELTSQRVRNNVSRGITKVSLTIKKNRDKAKKYDMLLERSKELEKAMTTINGLSSVCDLADILEQRVFDQDFSTRLLCALKTNPKISTVRDLTKLKKIDLLRLRNMGKRSIEELESFLNSIGHKLK